MFIKKILASVFVLIGAAAICFAQIDKNASQIKTAPDFDGTWKLSRIDGVKIPADSKSFYGNMTLKITSESSKIKIERIKSNDSAPTKTESFTYYSDGRGESNATPALSFKPFAKSPIPAIVSSPEIFESQTVLDNEKLVTKYKTSTALQTTGAVFTNGKDEWKLSEDGKKLLLTSSRLSETNNPATTSDGLFGNFQRTKIKFVFERVD